MYKKLNNKYGYLLDNINGYPLDKQQRKVVFDDSQNTIVIAGAGSGKTTTIIGKIKYLINVLKYNENEILCISFTNESVKSLKASLNNNNLNVDVKTFHKLSLDILDNNYQIISDSYLEYIIDELFGLENNEKKLILTIINLYKSQNLSSNIFYKIPKKYYKITQIILITLIEYQNEKKATNTIDFDDMISLATKKAKINKYKYIIIDEYQDSSLLRISLIQKLIFLNNAKLLVVGDDWQSIYRFSGCDLNIFLHFNKYFKNIKKLKLINTYRNSQELLHVAGNFIMKNPYQIKKRLKSNKSIPKPIKIILYKDETIILEKVLNAIKSNNILVLGRNNFDINKYLNNNLRIINNSIMYKEKNIRYMTIHKSKGLESDNVIIINVNNDNNGFPSLKKNEKIIKYFEINNSLYKNDEERRLFYVALTRTKNNVYLLANKNNPSIFIKELLKNYKIYIELSFW